jgi:hypothetical protein
MSIRSRFSSASPFVTFKKSFILLARFANERNMQQPPAPVKPKTQAESDCCPMISDKPGKCACGMALIKAGK